MQIDELREALHTASDAQPSADVEQGRNEVGRIVRRAHRGRVMLALGVVTVFLAVIGVLAARRADEASVILDGPPRTQIGTSVVSSTLPSTGSGGIPRLRPTSLPPSVALRGVGPAAELSRRGAPYRTNRWWFYASSAADAALDTSVMVLVDETLPEGLIRSSVTDRVRTFAPDLRFATKIVGDVGFTVVTRGLSDAALHDVLASARVDRRRNTLDVSLPDPSLRPVLSDVRGVSGFPDLSDLGTPMSGYAMQFEGSTVASGEQLPGSLVVLVVPGGGELLDWYRWIANAQPAFSVRGHPVFSADDMSRSAGTVPARGGNPPIRYLVWQETSDAVVVVAGQGLSMDLVRSFAEGLVVVRDGEFDAWAATSTVPTSVAGPSGAVVPGTGPTVTVSIPPAPR